MLDPNGDWVQEAAESVIILSVIWAWWFAGLLGTALVSAMWFVIIQLLPESGGK